MVLYVLLVWFCAIGCVVLAELTYLSFEKQTSSHDILNNNLTEPGMPIMAGLVLALGTFVLGLALAYWIERSIQPVHKSYLKLQKSYPSWYQKWPADKREIILAVAAGLIICSLGIGWTMIRGFNFTSWGILSGVFGFSSGLLIIPILRFRGFLLEDRPEQPPQAILNKLIPQYSTERALKIGQIYLRLLLPVFSLFCMLILPLALELITINNWQASLLMIGLFGGAILGWMANQDSHLQVERFQYNLYQLSALALLSSAFLLFGLSSGNNLEIALMSCFSGYLAGIY